MGITMVKMFQTSNQHGISWVVLPCITMYYPLVMGQYNIWVFHGAINGYNHGNTEWEDHGMEYITNKTVIPSGNLLQFANWKVAIEIVDLPIKNGDFPELC